MKLFGEYGFSVHLKGLRALSALFACLPTLDWRQLPTHPPKENWVFRACIHVVTQCHHLSLTQHREEKRTCMIVLADFLDELHPSEKQGPGASGCHPWVR